MSRKSTLYGLIGAVAAVGLVAGCGSSTSGEGSKTATIGLLSILTGPGAPSGVAMDCGVKAYLDGVNATGGANGYQFKYIERDSQYDPAKSATIAREFANDDVIAVPAAGTAGLQASFPILKPKNIAVFGLADGSLFVPPPYDGAFGLNPETSRLAASDARFILEKLNIKTASVAYTNTPTGIPASKSFPQYFSANGGAMAANLAIDPTTTDYSPYAQKLKAANAPVVYVLALDTQVAALQKASAAIGYNPTWMTWFAAYTPSYLDLAGSLADGTYVEQYAKPVGSMSDTGGDPDVQAYRTAISKACPDQFNAPGTASGWIMGALIERGVAESTKDGKALTHEGFNEAVAASTSGIPLIPSVTYNAQGNPGSTEAAYYQIEGKTLKEIAPFQEFPPEP